MPSGVHEFVLAYRPQQTHAHAACRDSGCIGKYRTSGPSETPICTSTVQKMYGIDGRRSGSVIRRKLLDYRLPRGRAPHLWNASGQERICDGCDEKIDPQDKAVWGIAVRD